MVLLKIGRRGKTKGFTLNEVIVCIAIVSIAFLGTMASLTASQRATGYGERMTEATTICRQICEIIRSRGLANVGGAPPAAGTELQTDPFETTHNIDVHNAGTFAQVPAGTRYTRSIKVERVGTTGYQRNLLRVTVAVWWQEGSGQGVARWTNVRMTTFSRIPLT